MQGEPISHIVIVDDSDDEIFLTELLFKNEKLAVDIVHCPDLQGLQHLLEKLSPDQIRCSLVLVDMNLPQLRGTEIVAKLRKDSAFSKMTIGICSGSEDPADIKSATDCGADFFVSKPLNKVSLTKICERVGNLQISANEKGWSAITRVN